MKPRRDVGYGNYIKTKAAAPQSGDESPQYKVKEGQLQ